MLEISHTLFRTKPLQSLSLARAAEESWIPIYSKYIFSTQNYGSKSQARRFFHFWAKRGATFEETIGWWHQLLHLSKLAFACICWDVCILSSSLSLSFLHKTWVSIISFQYLGKMSRNWELNWTTLKLSPTPSNETSHGRCNAAAAGSR